MQTQCFIDANSVFCIDLHANLKTIKNILNMHENIANMQFDFFFRQRYHDVCPIIPHYKSVFVHSQETLLACELFIEMN